MYSFGLLCVWVLFGNSLFLSAASQDHREDDQAITGLPPTVVKLASLKKTKRLQDAVRELVFTHEGISREQQSRLDSLFTLTLAEEPTARSSDFQMVLRLLEENRFATPC